MGCLLWVLALLLGIGVAVPAATLAAEARAGAPSQRGQSGPPMCGEFRATGIEGRADARALVQAAVDVIDERLRAVGVDPGIVEAVGGDEITVEAQGDPALLRRLITAPGEVAFVPVPGEHDERIADGSPLPPGMADVEPLFTGEGIASARAVIDESGLPAIELVLAPDAAGIFDEHASAHQGERFAIVIDGVVHAAPAINAQEFGGEALISGGS